MHAQPVPVMTFATLDEAESALDWIGLDFADADRGFEGRLTPDDRDRLADAAADPESPEPVWDLARLLLCLLDDADAPGGARGVAWRVGFDA